VAYTTNTALAITGQIYIPENARFLEQFSVYVPNTTAASCLLQFFDVAGTAIQSSGTFTDRRNAQAYNVAMQLAQYCEVVNVGTAGVAKFKAEPSIIPTAAVRMSFAIQGTGLTTAGLFVNGVFS